MATYGSYKDSGVKWLGLIPSHWEVLPGKALCSENKSKNTNNSVTQVLSLSYGKIIPKSNLNEGLVPENYSGYQIVRPNYIIIRCTDLQNDKVSLRTGHVNHHGIISGAYLGLKPTDRINSRFFHFLLYTWDVSKEIYRYGSGLRQSLSWIDIKNLQLLVPPADEQTAIVAYLDKVTGEIDRAIEAQQKMIDALNERKQIIITRAVTRGLNPEAPLRDTDIDWLGQIPAHWKVCKLKWLISSPLQYGANESPDEFSDSQPRYIRITDIDSSGNLKDEIAVSLSWEKAKKYMLRKGDILFARSGGTVGKTYLFNEDFPACFAGYLIKASCNNKILPQLLMYFTQSLVYDNWKNFIFNKATIQNIGADKYSTLQIPVPPIDEQQAILTYFKDKLDPLEKAVSNCERMIALLTERKQIIINEVVTGKKKVI